MRGWLGTCSASSLQAQSFLRTLYREALGDAFERGQPSLLRAPGEGEIVAHVERWGKCWVRQGLSLEATRY